MAKTGFILGMRDVFFDTLFPIFEKDENTIFITADNGAPTLDKYGDTHPDRYYTVGIAEQFMIGLAAGLAVEGKKVYNYAIAPFITLRCFEQNKLDMCAMELPIVNIGVGRGYAYDIMGPTHHTVEDITAMRVLPNLVIYNPSDHVTTRALVPVVHEDRRPQYIRFDRAGIENIYEEGEIDPKKGLKLARPGKDLCILATGIMVHQALKTAKALEAWGIDAAVMDVFRLKPLNAGEICSFLSQYDKAVTMEEHLLAGGFGSSIAEVIVDHSIPIRLMRIGQEDRFVFDNGGREAIWEKYGLDVDSMAEKVRRFVGA